MQGFASCILSVVPKCSLHAKIVTRRHKRVLPSSTLTTRGGEKPRRPESHGKRALKSLDR
jgi:hypothetical protein